MKNIILLQREWLSNYHYIRKADPNNEYWFDFSRGKLHYYKGTFGDNFNLVIVGAPNKPTDFYSIPYAEVKHLFIDEHLSNDRSGRASRWVGTIRLNKLQLTNCSTSLDIGNYRGIPIGETINEKNENEYAIENRKQEINQRLKQSEFRKSVLSNFEYKCCLSGIKETDLLVASHIVPWADNISTRLDPANGLSLFSLYDTLFDQGYFTLSNSLHELKKILDGVENQKISSPINKSINLRYIEYHRDVVFKPCAGKG